MNGLGQTVHSIVIPLCIMDRRDLETNWAITRQHLEQAFSSIGGDISSSFLMDYHAFLDHNELGLAADALLDFAKVNICNRDFWTHLLAAAKNMGVNELVTTCQKQLAKSV